MIKRWTSLLKGARTESLWTCPSSASVSTFNSDQRGALGRVGPNLDVLYLGLDLARLYSSSNRCTSATGANPSTEYISIECTSRLMFAALVSTCCTSGMCGRDHCNTLHLHLRRQCWRSQLTRFSECHSPVDSRSPNLHLTSLPRAKARTAHSTRACRRRSGPSSVPMIVIEASFRYAYGRRRLGVEIYTGVRRDSNAHRALPGGETQVTCVALASMAFTDTSPKRQANWSRAAPRTVNGTDENSVTLEPPLSGPSEGRSLTSQRGPSRTRTRRYTV